MKARLTRPARAWLTALTLLTAAPVWASQPPAPPSVTPAPIDGVRAPAVVTRIVWDRVGAPLQGLS
ncbi:MAG: hypothetical protein ACK4TK_03550 [Thiobacillaceae bacterium]